MCHATTVAMQGQRLLTAAQIVHSNTPAERPRGDQVSRHWHCEAGQDALLSASSALGRDGGVVTPRSGKVPQHDLFFQAGGQPAHSLCSLLTPRIAAMSVPCHQRKMGRCDKPGTRHQAQAQRGTGFSRTTQLCQLCASVDATSTPFAVRMKLHSICGRHFIVLIVSPIRAVLCPCERTPQVHRLATTRRCKACCRWVRWVECWVACTRVQALRLWRACHLPDSVFLRRCSAVFCCFNVCTAAKVQRLHDVVVLCSDDVLPVCAPLRVLPEVRIGAAISVCCAVLQCGQLLTAAVGIKCQHVRQHTQSTSQHQAA